MIRKHLDLIFLFVVFSFVVKAMRSQPAANSVQMLKSEDFIRVNTLEIWFMLFVVDAAFVIVVVVVIQKLQKGE